MPCITISRRCAAFTLAALTLSGCATNPIVSWDRPQPNLNEAEGSMAFALKYARSAREAFQARVEQQAGAQTALASTLLGMGSLALGGGLARVNRDVITTLGWGGGTAYAFGQQGLRPERMQIYLAGVEAMNCALTVVVPITVAEGVLDGPNNPFDGLNNAQGALEVATQKMQAVLAQVPMAEGAPAPNVVNVAARASQQVQLAQAQLNNGRRLQSKGIELRGKVRKAARELINTTDHIKTAVDKAALETLPDLASIAQPIAGLGAFGDMVVPFAQLAQRQADLSKADAGTANSDKAVQKQALPPATQAERRWLAELQAASEALSQASARHSAAMAQLRDVLASVTPSASTEGLSQCRLAGIASALTASATSLTFSGAKDEKQSLVVSGGTPPYHGNLLSGDKVFKLTTPIAFDRRFDLTLTETVKTGSHQLLIQDSAAPTPRMLPITIAIGQAAAPPDSPEAPAPAPSAPVKTAVDDATAPKAKEADPLDALKTRVDAFGDKPIVLANQSELKIKATNKQADSLIIQFACKPKPGQVAANLDSARNTVINELGGQADYIKINNPKKNLKFDISPAGCVKGA